jgi:hypothetical protein
MPGPEPLCPRCERGHANAFLLLHPYAHGAHTVFSRQRSLDSHGIWSPLSARLTRPAFPSRRPVSARCVNLVTTRMHRPTGCRTACTGLRSASRRVRVRVGEPVIRTRTPPSSTQSAGSLRVHTYPGTYSPVTVDRASVLTRHALPMADVSRRGRYRSWPEWVCRSPHYFAPPLTPASP